MSMEIQPNKGASLPQEIKATNQPPPRPVIAEDTYAGQAAEALQRNLLSDDQVRVHVVTQGKELLSDANYPPLEIVRKIAGLVAASKGPEE